MVRPRAREELPTAISQNQARHHIAPLLGGPLGGLLYGASRALPFVFDTVTFAVSYVMLGRLRTDLSPVVRTDRVRWKGLGRELRSDLTEGMRYVFARPYFRTMVAFSACSNLVVNAVFFVAILRLVQQGVHPAAIGVISALAGVGGILGALSAPYIIDRMRTGHLTVLVAWSWVPLIVPLLFWGSPVLIGAMLFVGVFFNPAGNAGAQSYRVAITPARLQGRISSATQFVGLTTMPLAPILGGFLLEQYGARTGTAVLLVATVLAALIPTLSRAVRRVPRPRDWPVLDEELVNQRVAV